jgi:hypothetical protein
MHVMYSRPPYDILWHSGMSAENLLDGEAPWSAFQFVHVPLWHDWWLQVCHGHSEMSSQVEERRETIERVPLR